MCCSLLPISTECRHNLLGSLDGWLKYIVKACLKPVESKKLVSVRNRHLPAVVVFKVPLDVGPNQELDPGAQTIARVESGRAVKKIGGRIHRVVPHESDHPGIHPIS